MFDELFLQVLELTKVGSIVILAVLVLRQFLKLAPKAFSYALWAVVLFRLLVPWSFEAENWGIELENSIAGSYTLANDEIKFSAAVSSAAEHVGDTLNGGLEIYQVQVEDEKPNGNYWVSAYWWEIWILFGKYVWAAGVAVLAAYGLFSLWRLRRQIVCSMPLEGNWADAALKRPEFPVYLADGIPSPFVVGLFRPKIYLPSSLSEQEQRHILLHEQHHIRRGDHWWKLLGFLALCVHWFNPLAWLAFVLAGKDMEMSCDEAVLKKLGPEIRKAYSESLLNLATGRRIFAGTPLAFGEGDPKSRIKNVLRYRRPALLAVIGALLVLAVSAVILLTDRVSSQKEVMGAEYRVARAVYDVEQEPSVKEFNIEVCITTDYHLYTSVHGAEWTCLGELEAYPLTKSELERYTAYDKGWVTSYRLRDVTDAYILRAENDGFYLVFQTKNGDTLLGYGWEDMGERGEGASDDTNLQLLYLLESQTKADRLSLDELSYLERSLGSQLGVTVECFQLQDNQKLGYVIAGFQHKNDLGFAVFAYNDIGFQLTQLEYYENAARVENGIFICENPAVLGDQDAPNDSNTFDVVLSVNAELKRAVRTVYSADGKELAVIEKSGIQNPGMLLFSWQEQDAGAGTSVSQHFYDDGGGLIEAPSVRPASDEEALLERFAFDPDFAGCTPYGCVLAEDGAEDLEGVILYQKPGYDSGAWIAFLCSDITQTVGIGTDGTCHIVPETELTYMGNGQVGITLEWGGLMEMELVSFSQLPEGIYVKYETISNPLSTAIREAVLAHNRPDENPADILCSESHVVLAMEENEPLLGSNTVTVYLVSQYAEYRMVEESLEETGGNSGAAVLTFRKEAGSTYTLTDYWEPRMGAGYDADIREKFPDEVEQEAIMMENSMAYLQQTCLAYAQQQAHQQE